MKNDDKLKYIENNYINARMIELIPEESRNGFLENWLNNIINTIPYKLYKYRQCNDNNLNALRDKKAWFSNPFKWNDPIDFTTKCDLENDLKTLENNFDDYSLCFSILFVNKIIDCFCNEKKIITIDKIKEIVYSCINEEEGPDLSKMNENLSHILGKTNSKQLTTKIQEIFKKTNSNEFRSQITANLNEFLGFSGMKNNYIMYSLSETYYNNRQWATYADDGKGFCIEYDLVSNNKHELEILYELLPIYYGGRQKISLLKMLDETLEYKKKSKIKSDLNNLETKKLFVSLYTKEPEWSGENEWRFSLHMENCTGKLIDFDFAKALYLGDKIEKDWKEKLLEIAKEQKLLVYQRKLDRMKSNLIYEKIEI